MQDGASTIVGEEGFTDTGRRLISGYLSAARALTAFGNTVSTSYLRFTDHDDFEHLPASLKESADALEAERDMFEADGVFPSTLIVALLVGLRDTDDAIQIGDPAKNDAARKELIRRHWHVG